MFEKDNVARAKYSKCTEFVKSSDESVGLGVDINLQSAERHQYYKMSR